MIHQFGMRDIFYLHDLKCLSLKSWRHTSPALDSIPCYFTRLIFPDKKKAVFLKDKNPSGSQVYAEKRSEQITKERASSPEGSVWDAGTTVPPHLKTPPPPSYFLLTTGVWGHWGCGHLNPLLLTLSKVDLVLSVLGPGVQDFYKGYHSRPGWYWALRSESWSVRTHLTSFTKANNSDTLLRNFG